jgi:hypothetical protein
VDDFSHPLREIYFRRLELIDRLGWTTLVVDSYDVLCLQRLPAFEKILGGSDVAACVEHMVPLSDGTGLPANFLNGGVFFWNVPAAAISAARLSSGARRGSEPWRMTSML